VTTSSSSQEQGSKPQSNTWQSQIADTGEFERRPTKFRGAIRADGSTAYLAKPGRYHLYVSYACPWAHRTLIVRKLKGLEDVISFDVVDTFLQSGGWTLRGHEVGATGDRVNHFHALREVYEAAQPDFEGAITVPVLWDIESRSIVNNESAEIIRQMNSEFQAFARHPEVDLYPEPLRAAIDAINEWVYSGINNGVYQCGFARSQQAYDRAAVRLFASLDRAEGILSRSRYLTGSELTEADVRLFTTLLRFDLVYHTHFKCNLRRIVDYHNLWGFTRDVYGLPGVAETVSVDHIKKHYYCSHELINPFHIIPLGPELDFSAPHDRAGRFG
jgi:putative glutathione S-transferase